MMNAHLRKHRAKSIDLAYASKGDFFKSDPKYLSLGYTRQVPALRVHPQFKQLQLQANEGVVEVDTMILLDVSSSMGWPHQGFDQPRHVGAISFSLFCFFVDRLNLHRCRSQHPPACHLPYVPFLILLCLMVFEMSSPWFKDMEPRDRFPNMGGPGVLTFMFNSRGFEVGKMRRENFEQMWTLIRNTVFTGMRVLHSLSLEQLGFELCLF
jgi:hypothetical protein